MTTVAWLDELTPDALDVDPYPLYARLRRDSPLTWVPWSDMWFATSWAHCAQIAADDEDFVGATTHPTLNRVFGSPNIVTASGEVHRDLRRAVDPPLLPKSVNGYIEAIARPLAKRQLRMIDSTVGDAVDGRAELMAEYFEPVSVEALGAVLGLDGVSPATLRRWFHELNIGISNAERDPARFVGADAITAEIEATVDPILDALERAPDGSALSHMLHEGTDAGVPRHRSLIYPTLKVILLGGMQEPGHGAASALLGLLGAGQLGRVAADPSLVPTAVNEGLRWIAPIGVAERMATRDVTIGNVTVEAGQTVEIVLASANRDELRFARPDSFDIDRPRVPHMAFGGGEHFCSGHYFSRRLEQIMLEELLAAQPRMCLLPEEAPIVRGWVFRAPQSLPVAWV